MMKKSLVLFTVIAAALLLTGCLSPKINFRIEPNPIVVTFDDFALRNVTLHFRLSGIGSYTLKSVLVEGMDNQGELVFSHQEDMNETIFVVPGVSDSVDLPTVDLSDLCDEMGIELSETAYNSELKGKTFQLKITLTGKNPTSDTAELKFE